MLKRERSKPSKLKPAPIQNVFYEVEFVPGLEPFVLEELHEKLVNLEEIYPYVKSGNFQFNFYGDPRQLLKLRSVGSAFVVKLFEVPRPLALLGHQNFSQLLTLIESVLSLHPEGSFKTFRISAAGSDSPVFRRIYKELELSTGLIPSQDGDLFLRVRKPIVRGDGFEVSIRLTPRPLSVRPWRVCDFPGAINSTVAYVMARLSEPSAGDVIVNLGCGSGTILIERLEMLPAKAAVGVDIDPEALACARRNVYAAGLTGKVDLLRGDMRSTGLNSGFADVIYADLPFGHILGSHADNIHLYPDTLKESARIAREGARGIFITSEIRLMRKVIDLCKHLWRQEGEVRLEMDKLRLMIFVLSRL